MLTFKQIKQSFDEVYSGPSDDEVMRDEAWSDYTSSLCEDGEITEIQYHYCPSYDDVDDVDDDDIGETLDWILNKASNDNIGKWADDIMEMANEF